MIKTTLFFVFFVLLGIVVLAQPKLVVNGQVYNENTSDPLPYATVMLTDPKTTEAKPVQSCTTNQKGYFELKAPSGSYHLVVRHLGYEDVNRRLDSTITDTLSLGTISLSPLPEQLSEVIVGPLVQVSATDITYNLMRDPDRDSMMLHQILQKVPLIEVDYRGNLYVESPEKRILVVRNGKQDVLFSGMNLNTILKSIPANGFATVKLMLAPPHRYGSYDYVISIETDKSVGLFGVAGGVSASLDFNSGSTSSQSGILASIDKLRFAVNGGFTNTNEPKRVSRIEQERLSDSYRMAQERQEKSSSESWLLATAASYDLSKRSFLSLNVMHNWLNGRDKSELNSRGQAVDETVDEYLLHSVTRKDNQAFSLQVGYQYDFKKPNRILNVAYGISRTPSNSIAGSTLSRATTGVSLPPASTDWRKELGHTAQVHYSDPLSKSVTLEAGTGYTNRDHKTESRYYDAADGGGEIIDNLQAMDSRKHIVNAYARLSYRAKTINISLGLTGDYLYDGKGTALREGERVENISEAGFTYSPNFNISSFSPRRKLSRISFGYQLRTLRPSLNRLSSYKDYSNPNLITTGNPRLENEMLHYFNLGLILKGVSITFGYQLMNNRISPYWYEDESNVIVQSYENLGKYETFSFNTSYSHRIKRFWSSLMFTTRYTTQEDINSEKASSLMVSPSLFFSYVFKNKLNITTNIHYVYQKYTGYIGNTRTPFSVSISARQQLFKERLKLEMNYTVFPIYKQKTDMSVQTDVLIRNMHTEQSRIPLRVSVSYNLASFKAKPPRGVRRGVVVDDISPN